MTTAHLLGDVTPLEWTEVARPLLSPSVLGIEVQEEAADCLEGIIGIWYLGAEDGEALVIVGVGAEILLVAPASFQWTGPASLELAVEDLQLFPELIFPSRKMLAASIDRARTRRRRRYRRCGSCGESTAPEHREGRKCHGCMEREDGVVF